MPPFLREYIKSLVTFVSKSTYVFVLVLLVVVFASMQLNTLYQVEQAGFYRVTAMAKREVTPDIINVTIGSKVEGDNIVAIQEKANQSVNKTVEAIKALGIKEENIKTLNYNVNPVYDYEKGTIRTYSVDVSVNVKIEDVKSEDNLAGDVLRVAAENNLNEVRSLYYEVSNREEILAELKLEAIANAKAKKDQEAKASGIRLGELKNVEDGYANSPYTFEYRGIDAVASVSEQDSTKAVVSPGETELTFSVTLVYQIL